MLSHTELTSLPHVYLAFFLLLLSLLSTNTHTADKEFLIMHHHCNFYILNYIFMCMAASIFIEGHMWPYGCRLCTPVLNISVKV